MNKIVYIINTVSCLFALTQCEQHAVVSQPVADLIGYQLKSSGFTYETLPVAAPDISNCPRLHQLLYHEPVVITGETNSEYQIRTPHLFYLTHMSNKPQCSWWTAKKNIAKYEQLSPETRSLLPVLDKSRSSAHLVTLKKPLYCKSLNLHFSVGTRFKIKHETKEDITVYVLDPHHLHMTTWSIPKHAVVRLKKTNEEKINQYVQFLRSWAHMKGYIPYVWGGCSIIEPQKNDTYKIVETQNGAQYCIEGDQQKYKNGFDCAGLITRAAQAAGLPYYFKNTYTLKEKLKPVTHAQALRDGDLIWIPGHVMAIGNMQKNTIIEARHYSHGYGKLHEISLQKVFKDCRTFDDLYTAIQQQQPLKRLNKAGTVVQIIKHAHILSIASCFDQ